MYSTVVESLKNKLKDICRWIERIEGIDVFEKLFVAVFYSFNDDVHYKIETSAKEESLFKVDDFEFIVTLVVTRSVLDYLLPVTRKLQAKYIDLAKSIEMIENLKLTIKSLRDSVETYHENWCNSRKASRKSWHIRI